MLNKKTEQRIFWLIIILIVVILGIMVCFIKHPFVMEDDPPVVDGALSEPNMSAENTGGIDVPVGDDLAKDHPGGCFFDVMVVNIGDEICGLTLQEKKANEYNEVNLLDFTGQFEVKGTYEHWGNMGSLTPAISFYPDDDSLHLFPQVKDDERQVWLNLNNYHQIKDKFSEAGSSGQVRLIIDNYQINLQEGAVSNTADLVKIVQIEANTVEDTIALHLGEQTRENVLKVFYDDFDGDGVKEAFVLTGELVNNDAQASWQSGKVWFVGEFYKLVQEGLTTFSTFEPQIVVTEDTKLLHVVKENERESHSYLFGVHGGKPYARFAYEKGYLREENGVWFLNNRVTDAYYEEETEKFVGDTDKDYYLFLVQDSDGAKVLREYGAVEITVEQFQEYEGSDDVFAGIKTINKNAEVTNILYRENGIINLNFVIPDDLGYFQKNVTVNYGAGKVDNFRAGEGKYEIALVPEIASFPSSDE